jgi:hypothetical protein
LGGREGGEREERWETFWNLMFPKVIAYVSFMFPQSANVYVLQFSVKYSKGMELLIKGSKQVEMIKRTLNYLINLY